MPALKNTRYEAYAQHRAKGKTKDKSYALAGFKPHRSNARRLDCRPEVQARIAELQGKAAEKAVTTVADIAKQLDEDRAFARTKEQASAAVSATMGKAKVLGLIVDKHVVGMKNIDEMNENELRALLGALDQGKT